jgi:hypothetical protein
MHPVPAAAGPAKSHGSSGSGSGFATLSIEGLNKVMGFFQETSVIFEDPAGKRRLQLLQWRPKSSKIQLRTWEENEEEEEEEMVNEVPSGSRGTARHRAIRRPRAGLDPTRDQQEEEDDDYQYERSISTSRDLRYFVTWLLL